LQSQAEGPCYLRLASGREGVAYPEDAPFTFGRARIMMDYGNDVAVFCSGYLMPRAVEAVERLQRKGIRAVLCDVPTLKPLDTETVAALLRRTGRAVTVRITTYRGLAGPSARLRRPARPPSCDGSACATCTPLGRANSFWTHTAWARTTLPPPGKVLMGISGAAHKTLGRRPKPCLGH
jgi:hypothetical protein